jgi:hypothetical protein
MLDFSKIKTISIAGRKNKFSVKDMIPLDHQVSLANTDLDKVAQAMVKAKKADKKVIVMLGGAVVKVGCSLLLIDLIKKGFIRHLAGNGAVSIHDFEVAQNGGSSEDVVAGLIDGSFGMAEETGRMMNEAINAGNGRGWGYGRAVAETIRARQLPYKEYSLQYTCLEQGVPCTMHVTIGGDIIHQHPIADGAALGATSYTDFKLLTESVAGLAGGVLLNIGSAVNLPEVFLKAFTIARNLGHDARDFTVANFDFLDMYRARTRLLEWPRRLGCTTFDIRANHNQSIPVLHRLVTTAAR